MNVCIARVPYARSARSFLALAVLWAGSLGCVFEGKVGDDPSAGEGSDMWGSGVIESSTSMGPGNSSAAPGTGGTATTTTAGVECGSVDDATALEICGIVLVEPEPGSPVFNEGVECEGGESIDVVSGQQVHLYDQGECLCAAIGCGHMLGGTTGSFPGEDTWGTATDVTTDATASDSGNDTTGAPDACGPYPPGTQSHVCTCESCSAVLTNVDAQWLLEDADLGAICECMCGWAGCGMPI